MPLRLNVLYVEDNPDDVLLFEHALRKIEARLQSVFNGAEAVEYLSGKGKYSDRSKYPLPDVIFLDWNMPVFDGRDFLQFRQKTPAFQTIPVVVLSGSGFERDEEEAKQLGADMSFPKPISLEKWSVLTDAVLALLASRKRREDGAR